MGDSHADAIKTVFTSAAHKNNSNVYFYVDNNPLEIKALPAEKIIFDAKRIKSDHIVLHYSAGKYERESFAKQLQTLQALAKAEHLKLSLIAPMPYYPVTIPKVMYEQEKEGKDLNFTQTIEDHRQKIAAFLSQKFITATIFDAAPILCPKGDNCKYSDNQSRPYYFDGAHLTLTGQNILQDGLTNFLANSNDR